VDKIWTPNMTDKARDHYYKSWKKAVQRSCARVDSKAPASLSMGAARLDGIRRWSRHAIITLVR
jgi:hypothetical protein